MREDAAPSGATARIATDGECRLYVDAALHERTTAIRARSVPTLRTASSSGTLVPP